MATPNIVPRADQEGGLGTAAKSWGKLFIENAAAGGTAAVTISNLDVDKVALDINANNTSENVIDITATALNDNSKAGIFLNVKDDSNDILMRSSNNSADFTTIKVGANAATTITTKDGVGAVAHFEIAADGDIILDSAAAVLLESTGDMTLDSGGQILLEPAAGSNILLDGTIAVDAGVVTGATSITSTVIIPTAIAFTPSTDDTFVITSTTHGATSLTTIDTASAEAHLTVVADGNVDIDGLVVTLDAATSIELEGATNVTGALSSDTSVTVGTTVVTDDSIVMTPSTDDTFTIASATNGATTLTTIDTAGAAADFEVAADGNIILDAEGDIALEAGGGDVTVDADAFVITSATSQKPFLELKSTTNDNKGSAFQFTADKGAAGVDGDFIGTTSYVSDNDAQAQITFARITTIASEVAAGDEAGHMKIDVANDGALRRGIYMQGNPSTAAEVNVTIASGNASTTTLAGTLIMGSTAAMGNTGLLTVGAQTGITATANLVTVGALNSGTITSGFGNIDNGSSTFDTGAATVASLVLGGHSIDDIDITAEFVDADAHIMSSKAIGARFAQKNADTTGNADTATKITSITNSNIVQLAGSQTLTGTKTLNSFKGTAGATVTNILDEDAMGSDSATALATQQSIKAYVDAKKQVMHYPMAGFSTGNSGGNFEMPGSITVNKNHFDHTVSSGSAGTTAVTVSNIVQSGGIVFPKACTLTRWTGWAACAGSATGTIVGLFKVTPVDNNNSNVAFEELVKFTYQAAGNNTARSFNVPTVGSFTDTTIDAGDIVVAMLKSEDGAVQVFTSTFEVEF